MTQHNLQDDHSSTAVYGAFAAPGKGNTTGTRCPAGDGGPGAAGNSHTIGDAPTDRSAKGRPDGNAPTDRSAIEQLLTDEPAAELFARADRVRHEAVGDEVQIRGIIEFSNICRNDCFYCGIRRGNASTRRYRMSEDEAVAAATRAAALGYKTVVLQSGEDLYFDSGRMSRIIERIKRLDVAVTLGLGEREYSDYKAFKDAGADRYLLRIETTDQDLYRSLHPGMDWQHRHECLMMIKELGYELGSGFMVGLPGQSTASIAGDLLYLKDIGVDMAGIGPFIPHPGTPLRDEAGGTLEMSMRAMAAMRLLLPDINIPATTAMETLHPEGRMKALQAGANVIMLNVTGTVYGGLYDLYPGKEKPGSKPEDSRKRIEAAICSIGRTVGQGPGGHKRK